MRQIWHILKKDLRGLQGEIYIFLIVMAMSYGISESGVIDYMDLDFVQLLIVAAGFYLTGRAIHAERIPGTSQFWVTRPYNWKALLAAKILFLVVCIHVPLLIARSLILVTEGFPLTGNLPGLIWSQALILCASLVVVAFAAVTPGFTSFVLAILGALILLAGATQVALVARLYSELGRFSWARSAVLAASSMVSVAVVLYVQYRRRNTTLGATLLITTLSLSVLASICTPFSLAWSLQKTATGVPIDESTVRVTLGPANMVERLEPFERDGLQSFERRYNYISMSFPLLIGGVPQGTPIRESRLELDIEFPDGKPLAIASPTFRYERFLSELVGKAAVDFGDAVLPISIYVNGSDFKRAQGQRMKVRGSIYWTVFRDSLTVTSGDTASPVQVLDSIRCTFPVDLQTKTTVIQCRSALRRPGHYLYAGEHLLMQPASLSPFPADLTLDPIEDRGSRIDLRLVRRPVTLRITEPIAYVRKDFEFSDVLLQDYRPE